MDQKKAAQLLKDADSIDGFRSAVIASPVNTAARASCQYTVWPEQEEYYAGPGKVIIMSPSAEGGMPHTRAPDLICLPAYWPKESLAKTLEHELVHISQRRYVREWSQLLEDEGWSRGSVPAEWASRCRLNPDTHYAGFWAWEGRHIPLPIFVRDDRPNLRDIVVRWYDQEEGVVKMSPPTSYTKRYGKVTASEAEHPFELFAYRGIDPTHKLDG